MALYKVGDIVEYEGFDALIMAVEQEHRSSFVYDNEEWNQAEYAIEFDKPDLLENLFGCIHHGQTIIVNGYGAWVEEDNLSLVKAA